MSTADVVTGLARCPECLKTLLKLSSYFGFDHDPQLREALRQDEELIAKHLVSVIQSPAASAAVMQLQDDDAQNFMDVVQNTLHKGLLSGTEHPAAQRIIRKLSEASERLPSSLFITGVTGREEWPSSGGGFADVYRGYYNGKPVALKLLRQFIRGEELRTIRLRFCREALVWQNLHHPHILPLIGIDRDTFSHSLCMVSPWMAYGTVLQYLNEHGRSNVDKLLFEVVQGLQYIHSCNIVHGDLRGANIFITHDSSACLGDFGLSRFSNGSWYSTRRGGNLRWMAPELIEPERFGPRFVRTTASDVYAFGCVCLELYTGRPPFSNILEDVAAMWQVCQGKRPERPTEQPMISDTLWQCVNECWKENPAARPSAQALQHIFDQYIPGPLVVLSLDEHVNDVQADLPLYSSRLASPKLPAPFNMRITSTSTTPRAKPNTPSPLNVQDTSRIDVAPKSIGSVSRPSSWTKKAPKPNPTVSPFYIFRIVIVGDSGVGKSNLLLRFKYNHFLPGSEPTSGVEVVTHSTNTADGGFVNARIWDTAGNEQDRKKAFEYCRDAAGILIVYDIANYASYANVVHWLTEIRNHTNSKTVLTLVGNKSDLISRRAVSTEEASQFSLKNGLRFMETSAMTAMNVRFVFDTLFSDIYSQSSEDGETNKKLDKKPTSKLGAFKSLTSRFFTSENPEALQHQITPFPVQSSSLIYPRHESERIAEEKYAENNWPPQAVRLQSTSAATDLEGGRENEDEDLTPEHEVARIIAFLVATASEDWTMVLDACSRVSADERNAKAAIHALRGEFKYGVSAAQLAAARLWAILLHKSPDVFGSQTSSDFLDTLEELIGSPLTSIVVRERIMLVLAAAAYAGGSTRDNDFRRLWRRVRPLNKPEIGIPFAADDAIFNSPLFTGRHSYCDYESSTSSVVSTAEDDDHLLIDAMFHHNENDMYQMFDECKIGSGNADLLVSALIVATPKDLNNSVIKEFYSKCRESHENILQQIPWATAEAERSRAAKELDEKESGHLSRSKRNGTALHVELSVSEPTCEEQLLADLLATNAEILEALQMYDDLERVGSEREAENRGRKEVPTYKPLPALPTLSVAGPSRPRPLPVYPPQKPFLIAIGSPNVDINY